MLIKLRSTPLVTSYCDAQDTKYTDDFDVALIVSRVETIMEKTEITLKFYLMLTSKRELYPKREVESSKLGKFRTVSSVTKSTSNLALESPSEASIPSIQRSDTVSSLDETTTENQEINTSGKSSNDSRESGSEMSKSLVSLTPINSGSSQSLSVVSSNPPPPPPPPPASTSSETSRLIQFIRQESINYLGYYSSHEQLMQQMIMSQASKAREHITSMIERGALHCRTHLLWNKLLENKSLMNYQEFTELCNLAKIKSLSSIDPRLTPLINQPVTWYQALSKVLQNKYQDYHKQYISPDGNITHHLILHPNYLQAFMMLTIDLHTSRGVSV